MKFFKVTWLVLIILTVFSCQTEEENDLIDKKLDKELYKNETRQEGLENVISINAFSADYETEEPTIKVFLTLEQLEGFQMEENSPIILQEIDHVLISDEALGLCIGAGVVFGSNSDINDVNIGDVLDFYDSCDFCQTDGNQRFQAQNTANICGCTILTSIDCYYVDAFGNTARCSKFMVFNPQV